MKDSDFERLVTSVRQAGRIKRGEMGCSIVPPPRDVERLRAIYDSAVSYQDARLGDLMVALERWGMKDETMIVVTADHGEEWFEDGRCGHGASLRDSLVRVPLLVHRARWHPGLQLLQCRCLRQHHRRRQWPWCRRTSG